MAKAKLGRPSSYDPKYCDLLIAHMESGLSFESFAAVIGVNRDTLYEWQKVHSDFSDSKRVAMDKNLIFWEKAGIEGLFNETEYNEKGKPEKSKSLNSTIWIFNMKNRHGWRDRQPDEVDKTIINNNSTANKPDEELDARIKELEKKFERKE